MKTVNRDSGSLFVGNNLPVDLQKQGAVSGSLVVRLAGETEGRKVTYIMGSEKKGWHLCARGSGPFPASKEGLEVEFELTEE